MNKYKLSPQEYRQLLSKVELDNITLVEYKATQCECAITENIDISIKETSRSKIDNDVLKIYMNCAFLIKNKDTHEEFLKISSKYRLDFKIENDNVLISEDFIKIFTDNTVKITIWPYFRQDVNEIVTKMNFSSLVLPLKRK